MPLAIQVTPAPAPTRPAADTAAPAPTKADLTPVVAPSGLVVTYQKSGGFAGKNDTLTVYASGVLELHSRFGDKTAQVAPAELTRLQQLLASPEFAALEPSYEAAGADLILYSISVPGRPQPTVETVDSAQHPPVLSQVIDELEKLVVKVEDSPP
jgi:hypothetical protein